MVATPPRAFDDLPTTVLQSLMVALVLSRLDYGSRLQSVQNAAARLVFAARRNDDITPLLHSLHWLRVAERITFRLAVLTYRCLHGSAPEYLTSLLQCVSEAHTRQRLALLRLLTRWCHGQFAPPSVNGLSIQQLRPHGMLCLVLSVLPHQCYSSEVDSRQNYSRVHTSNLTEFVSASL